MFLKHDKLSEPILEMISNALFISSNDELPVGDFSSSPEFINDDDEKLLNILLHLHRLSSKLFREKLLPRLLNSSCVRTQLIGMRVVNRLESVVEVTSIVSKHHLSRLWPHVRIGGCRCVRLLQESDVDHSAHERKGVEPRKYRDRDAGETKTIE